MSASSQPDRKPIALYGLGNMGYLVGQRLAGAFDVKVADLDTAAIARAAAE
jgi:3-hydroxyisobutyrate dehydrogenase-like beta-hydroxyacid dehydrogenase